MAISANAIEALSAELGPGKIFSMALCGGYLQARTYASTMLSGPKPSQFPALQPTRIEMAINLKTGRRAEGRYRTTSLRVHAQSLNRHARSAYRCDELH